MDSNLLFGMLKDKILEISITAGSILVFFILKMVSNKIIFLHAQKNDIERSRTIYTRKFFNFLWFSSLLVFLGFVWNVSFKGLFVSFFAVAGVALFATWSMLSNITASVILFFNFPFKIGSKIKILDKDDLVEGIVKDITFFAILIESEDGDLISYPNNIAIQKGIVQFKTNNV